MDGIERERETGMMVGRKNRMNVLGKCRGGSTGMRGGERGEDVSIGVVRKKRETMRKRKKEGEKEEGRKGESGKGRGS